MDDTLKELKSIQSTFLALKEGVQKGSELLIDFVNSDNESTTITEDDTASIVSLVMLDTIIKDEVKYSLLEDFDFSKDNIIYKRYKDKEKCISNIKFLVDFLDYRVEVPVDIASC